MDRTLVIVRHGQSEWNLLNLFTGWRDVDLSPKGIEEAKAAGRRLKAKGLRFGIAFTSALKRAQRTLDIMLDELGQTGSADVQGPGAQRTRLWRPRRPQQGRRAQEMGRGAGASLAPLVRHRAARRRIAPRHRRARVAVLPPHIQPHVMRGEQVLDLGARQLAPRADHGAGRLSPDEIVKCELETGVPILYRLNADSSVASREIFKA